MLQQRGDSLDGPRTLREWTALERDLGKVVASTSKQWGSLVREPVDSGEPETATEL